MKTITGVPLSEQQSKSSGCIIQLSKDELEAMKVACRVRVEGLVVVVSVSIQV